MGGGGKSEDSRQAPTRKTKAAVDRRQNNRMLIKAVSARHCAATSVPGNCCPDCCAEQSHKDNVRSCAVRKAFGRFCLPHIFTWQLYKLANLLQTIPPLLYPRSALMLNGELPTLCLVEGKCSHCCSFLSRRASTQRQTSLQAVNENGRTATPTGNRHQHFPHYGTWSSF